MGAVSLSASVLVTTAKDRPSSHLLQSKEACPCGRQYRVSTESEISVVLLFPSFWNSSKGPFILGEIPFGRLDLGWSLESNKALSLWSGSTDSKILDKQTNAATAAAKSLQSCPTLCNPRDSRPPGSPVPGILQARTLEWVAISFFRGSSQPRDRTCVSCIGRWIL